MIADNKQFKTLVENIKCESRLFNALGRLNSAFLRRDYFLQSDLCKEIYSSTDFLSTEASLSERIYCVVCQIKNIQLCICESPLTFKTYELGYSKSCNKCTRKVNLDWKTSSKTTKENITREYNNLIEYILDKNTAISSYDETIEFIKNKASKVKESEKLVSRSDIRDKKHILKHIINLTSYLEFSGKDDFKWSNRMYNIMFNMHNGKLCDVCKVNSTRYNNFIQGYTQCCNNKECIQAIGCNHRIANHIKTIIPIINQQGFDIIINDTYKGVNYEKVSLDCKKCNTTILYDISNGNWKNIRCYNCYGKTGISLQEKEVVFFVKQFGSDVLENYKLFQASTKELDIFIPSRSVAIEFNGSLWHSFGVNFPKNIDQMASYKNNHILKHKMCKDHNIKLLQINSYEWNNSHKQLIWQSIIKNSLGISERFYARKCTVVEISSKEANNFLNQNHLQGMNNATVKLGLKLGDKILSVMTFSKPRFNQNYEWELVRFCNLLNTTVVGGASKLLTYFIQNYSPKNIISYADVRYSDGNLYKQLGFNFIDYTPPSYVYVKGDKILSRFSAQKHRLHKLLPQFDENKTELQNMLDNGYRKMWDAGTMVFVLKDC